MSCPVYSNDTSNTVWESRKIDTEQLVLFHEGAKESSLGLNFKLTMNDIRSAVPNVFGTGHQFHGRQFFHGLGVEVVLVSHPAWFLTGHGPSHHLWPRDWGTLLDS